MPFDGLTNGRVPKAVLLDQYGKEILPSLDTDDRYDGLAVSHVLTFGSLYMGAAFTYNHLWDEAMKHSRQNALAMRRDAWLMSLVRERADETLCKKWHLEPDNAKDPWQKTVADGCTKIVKNIHHFQRMRRYLLEGNLWYGRYGSNLKWEWKDMFLPVMQRRGPQQPGTKAVPAMAKGRVLTVTKHKPVNGDKINFHADDTPYVAINSTHQDRIVGDTKIIYPTNLGAPALLLRGDWREKFLIHIGPDIDDADYFEAEMAAGVFGVGLRHRLYWLDFLRRDYFGAITEMLNRIGLGLVVIKYDQSNAQAKIVAESTAKKFSRRSIVVMPVSPDRMQQNGAVEVIETPVAGAAVMLELQKHVEDQIERFAIGQNISAGGGTSNPLEGTGKAEFAKDTKTQLCRGDADNEDENLTGSDEEPGLVGIIKKWTYSFADFPLRFVTDHEEDQPEAILEAVRTCVDMGVNFATKDVRELTGLSEPEEGEPTVGGVKEMLEQAQAEHISSLAQGGVAAKNAASEETAQLEEQDEEEPDQTPALNLSIDYAAEESIIPYHVDTPLKVSELIERIRTLGRSETAMEYLTYLKGMLRTNPQLRKKLKANDVAFINTMASLAADQQYAAKGPRRPVRNKIGEFAPTPDDLSPRIKPRHALHELHKESGLSLGDFQDRIRHLHEQGALELHPHEGPAYKLENEEHGIIHNGEHITHVSPTGKQPIAPPPGKAAPDQVKKFRETIHGHLAEHRRANPLGMMAMDEMHEKHARPLGLTIGQMHDVLRDHVKAGKVRLHPFTGAAYTFHGSKYALPHGQEMKFYTQPLEAQI